MMGDGVSDLWGVGSRCIVIGLRTEQQATLGEVERGVLGVERLTLLPTKQL
jgi:hypothetical protein